MSVDIPLSLISKRRIQQLHEDDFKLRREIEFHEERIEEHQNIIKKIRENLEYNRIEREFYKELSGRDNEKHPKVSAPHNNIGDGQKRKRRKRKLSEKKLALKKALASIFAEKECLNIREIMEKLKPHGIEWATYQLAFQELTQSGFLIRQERGMYKFNEEQ
ncbi:hypothetical protein ABNC90_16035 [Paenibacillus larvae]|uniref:Uncharacterized protein n=2 Tax=Paenibacillus larvae subsp. larvae TaxID=147375 RepID=V9W0H0_9BACL|nr:hypothetical protein [Paenibacillus larvae]AHD04451.1 hypothetical protein ERIC2_c06090 [Paenibacillus larvae subsp. larvae DSM 25430]AQT84581.1 hypothetical protein B1222_09565 [Paenibacillus larvae subsp. pulvifaciens]AQZ46581.1 hypothetical protein B5S25_08095 [Paenibacillus larvae subsp. pulvifaciens]AVF28298.1 hypothetical protein ERICIII_04234 [Paenibacillus larvae subsp. larvae]AVF32801.1 hypothetical protein ERICIV_03977 [Paenibacillus larvae subsp. larvae]